MSEKTAKPKDEAGVLGNLPATRATRVGGDRAKAKPAAKPKARAAAKPKTTAPRVAATPAREPAQPHRPRAVRAGAPALAESTERARSEPSPPLEPGSSPPTGTELVTTAIQAAGELAQIGLTVGGQVLRRAVRKLPKP
jgi:hypothetical protein